MIFGEGNVKNGERDMEHGRNLKTAKEYRDMFKATFVRKSRSVVYLFMCYNKI